MPSSGGLRFLLSTRPWRQPARASSGEAMPSEAVPASTVEVQLTYDEIADPKPPTGVTVSLVGYAADNTVRLVQRRTDADGIVRFTGLDTTGAVAYYALAQLPRKGRADRLLSQPLLLTDAMGVKVTLSAALRTSTAAPIDELGAREGRPTAALSARGKLRVDLVSTATTDVELVVRQAGSGTVLGRRVAVGDKPVLDVAAKPGTIVYVEATANGSTYRSLPLELVADRGAEIGVYGVPRVLATYSISASADDDALAVSARVHLTNYSWIPYAEAGHGPRIPLPRGATRVELGDDPEATFRAGELELLRPLPPDGNKVDVDFDVPATRGSVAWSLDLPNGAFRSTIRIEQEPGLVIEHQLPGNESVRTSMHNPEGSTYRDLDDVTLAPNASMTMTIRLPKPGPESAVLHACRRLRPYATERVGHPLDFTLARIGGGLLRLSSLRGKPALVNLMATSNRLSDTERPTLANLARRTGGLAIVMVASDRDPATVATAVGALPFPVVLDPPARPDDNVGATTRAWGIAAVPENLLVDRKGVVRYHFQNARDWDSPEALRCIRAFVAAP
jgi:hypothetical protein